MDNDELASSFAAKKENKELKAKIKELESSADVSEINIKSLISSANEKDNHKRSLDDKILNLEQTKTMHEKQIGSLYAENKELRVFISDLGRFPKFWARSYKKAILECIIDNGLWSGNND